MRERPSKPVDHKNKKTKGAAVATSKTTAKKHAGSSQANSIFAVANAAGVSIATVSRVMNNHSTVKPAIKRRVLEAVEDTGYRLNTAARALSSGRSRLFGVIISELRNPFFPELLQCLEEKAVALGYELLVASTAYDMQRMSACIDRMLERKVDGVAVLTFGIEGQLLNRFADRDVPLVFMDEGPAGLNHHAIQVDYESGIHQAVQHLAVLGHRRIAYVSGPEQHLSVAKRRTAVEKALREIGLALPKELIYAGDHTPKSGGEALRKFRSLAAPPTAVICSNDLTAIGVMHEAEEANLTIPGDLSLIGFDGIEIGAYMVPPLTTVVMSRDDIAEAAVSALWNSIEGKNWSPLTVETKLHVRRTTQIPQGSLNDISPAPRTA